ncbi:MAG: radical SAM family heme chaperone HemW [Alphaproteobacteria bacterium]|nr:radical SAM family heme chaperone HemW [Alphaproteobacteria bacterium]
MSTIYIHWPYCLSKCYYCDFNSIACKSNIDYLEYCQLYKNVLNKFIKQFYNNEVITSIYLGGGTPSLVEPIFIDNLLNFIYKEFEISEAIEITIEANPKTIDKYKAKEFKLSGINRISIGVQSIIDEDLRILGRIHNSYDAIKCVYDMSDVFNNISIDMIYNRPGQKIDDWLIELNKVFKLPIQHISMYELIIENNTYIKYLIDNGFIKSPNPNSDFMEKTIQVAKNNGFEMYEISNYVKNDTKLYSRHNLSYWNYDRYYGVGAGAHSRVSDGNNIYAIEQICNINDWMLWAKNPIFNLELLTQDDIYKEQLLMGLRTKFGVDINKLNKNMINKYKLFDKIKVLKHNSYVIDNDSYVILTYSGMLKFNMIVDYLT